MSEWTEWKQFPDPRCGGFLTAPIGPGCYEVRHARSKQLILFGMGAHVALRMTSLLPPGLGRGRRNNIEKREYVLKHIEDVEYRTIALLSKADAVVREKQELKANKAAYVFKT